jgi:hypothetical protein
MASDYAGYLDERYQGEVYGEALFRTLGEQSRDAALRAKLRVLEQLERETKQRLREELAALGLAPQESAERRAEGEALARRLAQVPWPTFMRGFLAEVRKLVEVFEKSERLAPPGKQALLRFVTSHERALGRFAELELEGADGSLAPIEALLKEAPAG